MAASAGDVSEGDAKEGKLEMAHNSQEDSLLRTQNQVRRDLKTVTSEKGVKVESEKWYLIIVSVPDVHPGLVSPVHADLYVYLCFLSTYVLSIISL